MFGDFDEERTPCPTKAQLPLLRHLTLDPFYTPQAELLFSNVQMPALNSLCICVGGHTRFSSFFDIGWPLFPHLRTLSISAPESEDLDDSAVHLYSVEPLLDCMPVLHSLKLRYLGDRWDGIVSALHRQACGLQKLEIEDCAIRLEDLVSIFHLRGLGSKSAIGHFAIRRCQHIPSEVRPRLEKLCDKLEWESYWEGDVEELWGQFAI